MFMCGETVVKYTRTMREGIEAQPAYWNSFVRPREKNPLPRFPPPPTPSPSPRTPEMAVSDERMQLRRSLSFVRVSLSLSLSRLSLFLSRPLCF